jgi:hypothetical protein
MRVFGRKAFEQGAQYQKIGNWLAEHPELWRRKRIKPNDKTWRLIGKALKAAGFYSQKTSIVDIKLDKLIRIAKGGRLSGGGPNGLRVTL